MRVVSTVPPASPNVPASDRGKKPVVLIPVTAEDVFRRRLKIGAIVAAGIFVFVAATWFLLNRSDNKVEATQSIESGLQFYNDGRFDQALMAFSHTIDLQSNRAEAWLWRAKTYKSMSKLRDSVQDLTQYLKLRPDDSAAWGLRAECYQLMQDYANATRDLDKAIELNPKLASAYLARGINRRYANQLDQAMADFNKVVELAPAEVAGYFERGALHQKLGQHDRAIADFSKIIDMKPDAPAAYLARALSRKTLGDEAGAKSDYVLGERLEGRR
jgi:tetratricopeptide (TPR) repeat protein